MHRFVLFLILFTTSAHGGDWPNWMGPRHDGVSRESGWSTDWPEDGLPVAWSKSIGTGFSSMSIVDGLLYTMGFIDGEEFVYCLNAKTGDQVWTHKYPSELLPNLHEGGPSSTPTVDGKFVYTLGKKGQLYCLDRKTGEVKWHHELQEELDVPLPEWGFSSSGFILGEKIIFEAGRVVAFNKLTGKKIWQSDKHEAGYGSAAAFQHDGKTLLATLDCEGLRVLDSETGAELAFQEWESPFRTNSTTPIIHDGKIFISTGYNVGCGLFDYADGKLTKIFSHRKMRNHFNNSILLDGYLYGFDGNSNLGRVVQLTCLDFQTGEVMWQQAGYGCGSLMVADGKLLVLSDKGLLAVVAANPQNYEEIARSEFLERRCWTVPVLLNGHVYGRNANGLLKCLKLPVRR